MVCAHQASCCAQVAKKKKSPRQLRAPAWHQVQNLGVVCGWRRRGITLNVLPSWNFKSRIKKGRGRKIQRQKPMEKKRVRGSGKHREKHPQMVQNAGISGLQMCPSGLPSSVPRTESCQQLHHGAQTRGHSLCLISLSCDGGIHGSLRGGNRILGQTSP